MSIYLFEIIGTRKNAVVEETYIINTSEGAQKALANVKEKFTKTGTSFVRVQLLKVLDTLFMAILWILSNYSTKYEDLEGNLEDAEFYDPFEKNPHILKDMEQNGFLKFNGDMYSITEKGRLVNDFIYSLSGVKA
jgi:coproporphyrinogen III oxidase-like Fe-S oxidoreductase